jgi:hypothetical protein
LRLSRDWLDERGSPFGNLAQSGHLRHLFHIYRLSDVLQSDPVVFGQSVFVRGKSGARRPTAVNLICKMSSTDRVGIRIFVTFDRLKIFR